MLRCLAFSTLALNASGGASPAEDDFTNLQFVEEESLVEENEEESLDEEAAEGDDAIEDDEEPENDDEFENEADADESSLVEQEDEENAEDVDEETEEIGDEDEEDEEQDEEDEDDSEDGDSSFVEQEDEEVEDGETGEVDVDETEGEEDEQDGSDDETEDDEQSALIEQQSTLMDDGDSFAAMPFMKGASDKQTVMAMAKSQGKPAMVLISSTTCPRCVELGEDMEKDVDMKALMSKFTAFHVSGAAGSDWGNEGYVPRVYFFDHLTGQKMEVHSPHAKFPYFFWKSNILAAGMKTALAAK